MSMIQLFPFILVSSHQDSLLTSDTFLSFLVSHVHSRFGTEIQTQYSTYSGVAHTLHTYMRMLLCSGSIESQISLPCVPLQLRKCHSRETVKLGGLGK